MSTQNALSSKRPLEEVDRELLNLTEEQAQEVQQQNPKKRKHNFAAMTQYSNNINLEPDNIDDKRHLSGYIKTVRLRNFMSHENFELTLGPQLNFIVGNNGSGKSAILTAITIGLGGKTSDTNRGTKLTDLIREGTYSAKITLHIDNSGYGSYEQGTFGETIIIERTLKRDSNPTFSLRSESGAEISNKKKDIQTVVDFFSIPISNPMCFLSQDAARRFLTASTQDEKYHHFMKGTLLEDTRINLERANIINKNAQENMRLHLENLKALRNEYDEAKKLVKEFNETSGLADQKILLQGKSLSIDIAENLHSTDLLREEVTTFQEKTKQTEDKITFKNEKIDRYSANSKSISDDIEDQIRSVGEKDKNYQGLRQQLREIKSEFEEQKQNQEEAKTNISTCQKKIESLNRNIDKLEKKIEEEMGGDKDQMREELNRLEKEEETTKGIYNGVSLKLQDLQNDESRVAYERQSEVKNVEQSIQRKRTELVTIQKGNHNFMSNFDRNMDNLLKTVKQNKSKFESMPIGPLGNCVFIKNDYRQWTRPIQTYLSGTLNSFVVSNFYDEKLLRSLMKQCGIRANLPILNYQLGRFDFANTRLRSEYPAVIDALQFESPEIECLFVDVNKIERTILIEDYKDARTYLRSSKTNERIVALAIRDQHSGYRLNGAFQTDSVSYSPRIVIKVGSTSDDSSSFIRQSINEEMEELENVKNRYHGTLTEKRSEITEARAELSHVRKEMNTKSSRITELRINVNKVVDTGALASMTSERENQQNAVAGYASAIEDLEIKINEITERAQPFREQYEKAKEDVKESQSTLQRFRESVNNGQGKIEKYHSEIRELRDRISTFQEKISQYQANIESLMEGIEKQRANLREFCSEEQLLAADLPSDQEHIKDELEKITKKIERAERQVGLPQEKVIELFEQCREKYKDAHERYVNVETALDRLQNSIKIRLLNYETNSKDTCFTAALDFMASLKIRKLTGKLVFKKDDRKLEIYISTPGDKTERSVDTLSGGEKSYSQMALLLATWKPMRSRIIALDEFDVFMDQVNRKVGTGLIVNKLKDNTRTQTIIITPQDIGKITDIDSTGVVIHKIKDPERQNNSNFYT